MVIRSRHRDQLHGTVSSPGAAIANMCLRSSLVMTGHPRSCANAATSPKDVSLLHVTVCEASTAVGTSAKRAGIHGPRGR